MFRAGNFSLPLGGKTYVMGILNVTPDSFSDGGAYNTPEKALARALEMQGQGADIIDVGANSTRPGAEILSAQEELERLIPVLDAVSGRLDVPVSVDTFYPECVKAALERGVSIINDVSGEFNSEMAQLAKEFGAGYVVTHNPSSASHSEEYADGVVAHIRNFFINAIELSASAGLPREQLCLDVGFGFGKSVEDNLEILRNFQWMKFKGIALLAGASRKRFIGAASGEENSALRDAGTVAAHTAAIAGGADIIRAHDVFSAVQGARVADAIYRKTV